MNATVEKIKKQVCGLNPTERSDLLCFLLDSFEMEPVSADAEKEWRTEIARRVAEIRSGAVVCRPVDEVVAELREAYR